MDALKPAGSQAGGPNSARSGAGRPLRQGVRDVFAMVFVATAAAILVDAAAQRARLRVVAIERAAMYEGKRAVAGVVRLSDGDPMPHG